MNQFIVSPDAPGGTRHYDFARRLNTRGIPVELVAADLNLNTRAYTRRTGSGDRQAIAERIGEVPFRWLYASTYAGNDWRRSVNMLSFGASALRYLLRAPVTERSVFIGSTPTLFAALAAELAARRRGVRFALEVRDLWPESLIEMTGREGTTAKGLRVIADYLYRRADTIIVLAKHNQQAIAARGIDADKFVYVPNSVDLGAFSAAGPYRGPRLPARPFLAIYAGAHGPANDLDTVVEAARILHEAGDETVGIVLVGDGVEKARLVERARAERLPNLAFLDPVPKADIPALFGACHAGLLTLKDVPLFRYGVSPNKLFDYMGAALPVVTNVQGECAEIVSSAGCGQVVAPADPRALAGALRELAVRSDRQSLGDAGRSYVAQHFNRDLLVDRLVSVLEPAGGAAARRG